MSEEGTPTQYCVHCGTQIEKWHRFCPSCGEKPDTKTSSGYLKERKRARERIGPKKDSRRTTVVIMAIALLAIIGYLYNNLSEDQLGESIIIGGSSSDSSGTGWKLIFSGEPVFESKTFEIPKDYKTLAFVVDWEGCDPKHRNDASITMTLIGIKGAEEVEIETVHVQKTNSILWESGSVYIELSNPIEYEYFFVDDDSWLMEEETFRILGKK